MALAELNPTLPRIHKIERMYRETHDTFTIELNSGNGGFHFAPGQFNMLYVFGVGEVPISISGDPSKPEKIVHTTRAVGAVTKRMHSMVRGDSIGVRGPFGQPWPVEEAVGKDVVIITGGIGLAPLRPAIYHILQNREDYNKLSLLYGARSRDDLLYRRQLEQWRGRFDFQVEITVDTAHREWRGNVGLVTSLIPRLSCDPERAIALVCGPEIMMRFVIRELLNLGVSAESIYLSMERNMQCGVGHCGRCQLGPKFTCKDGPVFRYDQIRGIFEVREL